MVIVKKEPHMGMRVSYQQITKLKCGPSKEGGHT